MVRIPNQRQDEELQDTSAADNDEIKPDTTKRNVIKPDVAIRFGLKFVRADRKRRVYTEHPDVIRPRRLEAFLLNRFRRDHLKVLLIGSVYIVYIDRKAVDSDAESDSTAPSDDDDSCELTWEQKAQDMIDARKVVEKARIAAYHGK